MYGLKGLFVEHNPTGKICIKSPRGHVWDDLHLSWQCECSPPKPFMATPADRHHLANCKCPKCAIRRHQVYNPTPDGFISPEAKSLWENTRPWEDRYMHSCGIYGGYKTHQVVGYGQIFALVSTDGIVEQCSVGWRCWGTVYIEALIFIKHGDVPLNYSRYSPTLTTLTHHHHQLDLISEDTALSLIEVGKEEYCEIPTYE